jgi:hypothetical protein
MRRMLLSPLKQGSRPTPTRHTRRIERRSGVYEGLSSPLLFLGIWPMWTIHRESIGFDTHLSFTVAFMA